MDFPVLTATGFFDDDQPGALHYYRNHVAHAPAAAAAQHYLVIGPWDHGGTQYPGEGRSKVSPSRRRGARHEGACTATGTTGRSAAARGLTFFRDRVAYFMMGADEWRYAPTLEGASRRDSRCCICRSARARPGTCCIPGV